MPRPDTLAADIIEMLGLPALALSGSLHHPGRDPGPSVLGCLSPNTPAIPNPERKQG